MNDKKVWNFQRICFICKSLLIREEENICSRCRHESCNYENRYLLKRHDCFDSVYCLFLYDGDIKNVVYDIKINLNTEPLFHLAVLMARKIDEEADLITYVPAYFLRRIIKGFNPSQILAEEISKIKNIPVIKTMSRKSSLLQKEQKKLSKTDRFIKIGNEYEFIEGTNIRGRSVILIDDILTTGATLNCCAGLLKRNGAARVIVGIIAAGRTY